MTFDKSLKMFPTPSDNLEQVPADIPEIPLRWLVIERKVLPSRSSWCSETVPEPYIACSKPVLQCYNGKYWVAVPEVHEKEYD